MIRRLQVWVVVSREQPKIADFDCQSSVYAVDSRGKIDRSLLLMALSNSPPITRLSYLLAEGHPRYLFFKFKLCGYQMLISP